MSWEEMSVRHYKCPCGSGTYTVKWFTDDWNRSEEHWEMDCPICKQKYQLYAYPAYDSGIFYSSNYWVSIELYEQVKKFEYIIAKTKEEIINLAHSRYMQMWLSYFSGIKTKKEIWRRLADNGKKYPSLSTFYSHTADNNLTRYITQYFYYDNLTYILGKLGIEDIDIDKRILEVKENECKLEDSKFS